MLDAALSLSISGPSTTSTKQKICPMPCLSRVGVSPSPPFLSEFLSATTALETPTVVTSRQGQQPHIMSPITTTPLSPPPRPSSSRSVANSISGSTLCDYPITTGGNISAFGSRNGNWPALLLGDLHFTAAETNLVVDAHATSHSSSANANGGATSYPSTNTERGYSDRGRVDRLNNYFRPSTSTDTNGTTSTSSINYSNNNNNNNSYSNPGTFATTRTRSQTSTSSASTGRSRASTNRHYLAGGTNSSSSSSNQASSSSSVNFPSTGQNHNQNSHPRGISPNDLGIGRYGPGTTAHNVSAATTTTTCTSSPISRTSSPTTQRSGGGHKRQHSMVTHEQIQTSNAQIVSSLPSGLVAVFVGATRGIGEATLKQFVRHAVAPRVYFVGRDRANGERVGAELANLNPEGEYHFRIADVSLLANVDEVCREIKCKERVINLLFMSCGTTIMGIGTFFFFFPGTFRGEVDGKEDVWGRAMERNPRDGHSL